MVTVIVVPVLPDSAEPASPAALAEIAAIGQRVTPEHVRTAPHMVGAQRGATRRRHIRRVVYAPRSLSGAGRELNPMLRPFAGNASLYAAIQVGPLVLDYVARRMMTSDHGWLRHTWWLPQTLARHVFRQRCP